VSTPLHQEGIWLRAAVVRAVVFDMDGVLVDTERDWDAARRRVAEASGGRWYPGATTDMIGMSSAEWSRYMHDELGVEAEPEEINRRVVAEMLGRVASGAPLLPGAAAAVESLAVRWPLALASSANRPVIDAVLEASGLARFFAATVSSEEGARESRRRTSISPRREPSGSSRRLSSRSRIRQTGSARPPAPE
jgi:beta-phosphoglucomutase-like phosphatase (HAD superfamily)